MDAIALRLLERTAERLQQVTSFAQVQQTGVKLQEDIAYLRRRQDEGAGPALPPIDLDTKT
jgi:hypothetical protein